MKPLLIILLLVIFCFQSCGQEVQKKTDKEDFITFLSDFSSMSDFQKKRISNKFIECEITTEGDSTCKLIKIKSWNHIKLVTNYVNRIYDDFNLNTNDTDERVFSIERIEGGSSTYYYFQRKKGQWFLVKRVVYL